MSKVKIELYHSEIRKLSNASVRALEQTAEALHTEIVRAQVVPRMDGTLQGEGFFVDDSESKQGKVYLVHSTPYARRLYFHPEYDFNQEGWDERVYGKRGQFSKTGREYKGRIVHHEGNKNAKGEWFEDWLPGGKDADFAQKAFNKIFKKEAGL